MKIRITIDCSNAAFNDEPMPEIERILRTVTRKLASQLGRDSGCICTTPESADKLLDSNGNTVGSLVIDA